MSTTITTKISSNAQVEEVQEDNDDEDNDSQEESDVRKEIRSDQLWAMLLHVKPTPSNLHKFISFLFSIPWNNAYGESAFSPMRQLYDDQKSRISTELIAAELKSRLNSSLSCTQKKRAR